MKNSLSKGFKCLKCFVIFYFIFICILGVGVGVFASYLLLFREENRIPKPRNVILYFLILPTALTVLSTILGWRSIKKKNKSLVKFAQANCASQADMVPLSLIFYLISHQSFSHWLSNFQKYLQMLVAVTAIVEISGGVWCFISLPEVHEEVQSYLKMKFNNITINSDKNWWNNLQIKHECCGLLGPTDYHSVNSIPFSCCGSDPEDHKTGSCTFLWQKGCIKAVDKQITTDLTLLSLVAICTAIFRIPGVFLSFWFAHKMVKRKASS